MDFHLVDLDDLTRALMLEEFDADREADRVYPSAIVRLGATETYYELQRTAFESGDANSLSNALAASGIFKSHDARGRRVDIPSAASRLGDGQFIAYYVRALARRAIDEGRDLEVYRGQGTAHHRPESDAMIGTRPDPGEVLEQFRTYSREPQHFSPVGKVNSGLAVKLV